MSDTLVWSTTGRRELQTYDATRLLASMNADMLAHSGSGIPDMASSGIISQEGTKRGQAGGHHSTVAWASLEDQYHDDDDDDLAVARRRARKQARTDQSILVTPHAAVTVLPSSIEHTHTAIEHGTFATLGGCRDAQHQC